jgi:hypothetical protein
MTTTTRKQVRSARRYAAIGLPPGVMEELVAWLEEEGVAVLRVERDDEGSGIVCFELAPWDTGASLRSLSQRFGCGLVPAPAC